MAGDSLLVEIDLPFDDEGCDVIIYNWVKARRKILYSKKRVDTHTSIMFTRLSLNLNMKRSLHTKRENYSFGQRDHVRIYGYEYFDRPN